MSHPHRDARVRKLLSSTLEYDILLRPSQYSKQPSPPPAWPHAPKQAPVKPEPDASHSDNARSSPESSPDHPKRQRNKPVDLDAEASRTKTHSNLIGLRSYEQLMGSIRAEAEDDLTSQLLWWETATTTQQDRAARVSSANEYPGARPRRKIYRDAEYQTERPSKRPNMQNELYDTIFSTWSNFPRDPKTLNKPTWSLPDEISSLVLQHLRSTNQANPPLSEDYESFLAEQKEAWDYALLQDAAAVADYTPYKPRVYKSATHYSAPPDATDNLFQHAEDITGPIILQSTQAFQELLLRLAKARIPPPNFRVDTKEAKSSTRVHRNRMDFKRVRPAMDWESVLSVLSDIDGIPEEIFDKTLERLKSVFGELSRPIEERRKAYLASQKRSTDPSDYLAPILQPPKYQRNRRKRKLTSPKTEEDPGEPDEAQSMSE